MRTLNRFEPFRGFATLQDQISRLFNDGFERTGGDSSLTTWAPPVDIYETEHELVVKAESPRGRSQGSRHSRGEQHPDHSRRVQVRDQATGRSAAASRWRIP